MGVNITIAVVFLLNSKNLATRYLDPSCYPVFKMVLHIELVFDTVTIRCCTTNGNLKYCKVFIELKAILPRNMG